MCLMQHSIESSSELFTTFDSILNTFKINTTINWSTLITINKLQAQIIYSFSTRFLLGFFFFKFVFFFFSIIQFLQYSFVFLLLSLSILLEIILHHFFNFLKKNSNFTGIRFLKSYETYYLLVIRLITY